ncbi:unnamed protein product [Parnassius mnemosyne]|uniref:Reverse transcriptase domain-containing protein n=1 Tax=Parnassius mnemosyne TaxID=213953 RepID=A0AAV1KNR0_9NEOP
MDKSLNCKLVSFNCRSIKRSVDDVRFLCQSASVIALQETWLFGHDIQFLSGIDKRFGSTGTSAMDSAAGMVSGRPYGGVGLLWNKSVFQNVSVMYCDNPRICGIQIVLGDRSILVFSVYMPTDKMVNLTEFTDCLSSVNAIINSSSVESVYILGDFNAHPNERFYDELMCFCDEQEWSCVDVQLLGVSSGTHTFVSEVHGSRRWLDHCVATKSAVSSILNVYVNYDVYWSDHYPLVIECNLDIVKPKLNFVCKVTNEILWGDRKPEEIGIYTKLCNEKLRAFDFPEEFLSCSDCVCKCIDHKLLIDKLYSEIVNALSVAATESNTVRSRIGKRPVVGWNRYVRDAHREARSKFLMWVWWGKPKNGSIYEEMHGSRSLFKSRLKWCQNHSEQIKMDILATQHAKNDFRNFWKSTNNLNSKPGLPVSVNGINDHGLIANMFREHFTVTSPLGPSQAIGDWGTCGQEIGIRFTAKDVNKAIGSMSRGKSPGHDRLSIEHLKHAGPHLPRVLAMFYNLCIAHSYLPAALMRTVVVPIVKNKTGDISDKSNYRPISLATIVAKVLDSLLNAQLDKHLCLHDNQFGFRPGLSTESAILCLKQTVKYYSVRRTPIYACFLDLSKAFDLVNYEILWQKLKDTGLPEEVTRIFKFWYRNQVNVVRWSETYSQPYRLECGVRQGGLTSPKLFNLYVNALIELLSTTHVGCHIDEVCLNNVSYADDMVLLSASVCGLAKLLSICESYARSHGLIYNVNKSECMVFQAKGKALPSYIPPIKLYGTPLRRVSQFKYLGHMVSFDLKDDADIERERRALSVRANMIARRFARCSVPVKVTLFRAYCTSFYTSSLWVDYTQKQYNALRVQYNNAFRMLLGLPRYCSASGMFADARVDCFYTTMRKRCTSLVRRVRDSSNGILRAFSDRFDCQYLNHCHMVHVLTNRACLRYSFRIR